ncbi:MAG: hypothetical protein IPL61_09570 [Myxococcales bacterium]|nr:hypothetical protein [Myxococcales bacterium]
MPAAPAWRREMTTRQKRGVVGAAVAAAALVAIVLLVARVALADNASDRSNYLSEINNRLERAASKLSGVESNSDDGYIREAENNISEAKDLVSRLDGVKDDDSTAKEVVYRYPGYISDFGSASAQLKALKSRQRSAEDLVRQCKAFDAAMVERAKAAKDDPRGAEELREFAKSVGRKAEDMMKDAERTKSEIERSRDDAKRFSASDGKWANVKDAVHRAAEEMAKIWLRDYEQARRDCEEVVKRERHRDVERALGELANSQAGRAELRKKLDEMLGLILSKVTDVQSQSSASDANGAVELTKQVESLLERLRSAQGDDAESRALAANWPGWNQELRGSLEALRDMKLRQNRADEGAGRCKELDTQLQATIRGYVGEPSQHKEGIPRLPGKARQLGNEWKPKLEAAANGDQEMDNLYAIAKRFSRTDAPWGDIRSRLHSSADKIRDHWKEKYSAAKTACTNLSLGEDHPDVKTAMAEMQRDTTAAGASYRELRAEFNRWKAEVDKLRDWSAQDVEEIRQAFCRAPDAGDWDEVNAVADRWASKLQDQWGAVHGQADRIKARAQELINKRRALKNGPKVITKVDEILISIAKLKEFQLKGSNNPLIKARADYGVAEHSRRQDKCGSNKEVAISNCSNPNPKRRDCKMDCVMVSGKQCTIVEIKPREAESLGRDQLRAYEKAVRDLFARGGASGFTGRLGVFRECISDDGKTLDLATDVELYDFCPAADQVGPSVQPPDASVPEEEE